MTSFTLLCSLYIHTSKNIEVLNVFVKIVSNCRQYILNVSKFESTFEGPSCMLSNNSAHLHYLFARIQGQNVPTCKYITERCNPMEHKQCQSYKWQAELRVTQYLVIMYPLSYRPSRSVYTRDPCMRPRVQCLPKLPMTEMYW